MRQIAILASGTGTNARTIIDYFSNHPSIRVNLLMCNRPGAGVIDIANERGVRVLMIERERFFNGDAYLPELDSAGIQFLVLAGFLWKVPRTLIDAYPNRIVNIHPALLPRYGGKGMYGERVHQAVLQAGDLQSGITIHYVDEVFDNGEIIRQHTCPVEAGDTPQTLARRIHTLEHTHYPGVIEEVINLQIPR